LLRPVGIEFEFVDQGRPDESDPPDLNVVSGTIAQVRIHGDSPGSANREVIGQSFRNARIGLTFVALLAGR
jgi:hypothetical protein